MFASYCHYFGLRCSTMGRKWAGLVCVERHNSIFGMKSAKIRRRRDSALLRATTSYITPVGEGEHSGVCTTACDNAREEGANM